MQSVFACGSSLLACPGISQCRSGVCAFVIRLQGCLGQAAYVHFLLWAAACDTLPPLSVAPCAKGAWSTWAPPFDLLGCYTLTHSSC